jgi:toxin-antitoxin system PIN domain toxin
MSRDRPGLLDVNVLLALAWPNHLHHGVARGWFAKHRNLGWATCPLTESSFVRISSNPRIGPEPRSVRESIAWLERLRSLPGHRFVIDDVSFGVSPELPDVSRLGHRQITDAHLLALARRNSLRLVTFDRNIGDLIVDLEERLAALCVLG